MVARLRGRILVLSLILLLFLPLAAQAEPSRVVQAEEILKKIELGQPVEYDGYTIEGDLNLSGLNLPVVLVERTWSEELGGLSDYEVVIVPPIIITNSVIKGSVNLNGTDFQNAIVFRGTRFEGPAFLIGSRFNQTVDFSHAQFNQTAYFRYAQFNQIALFRYAQFNQTDFLVAQFNQTVDFSHAQFNQTAYFWYAQFNQTADFRDAQFNQTANFRNARFNQTDFLYAQFNQEAHFEDARLFDVNLSNVRFSKEVFFDDAKINGTLSLYRTKYDKLNIRWSSINDLAYDDTAYYLLIENFKKQGFTDDASECYYSYRYKHMWELLRQGKVDSWFFDLLAWATNGYGLRPVWPLGWSVLFIMLGGAFFFVTKSISRSKGPEPSGNRRRAIRGKELPQRAGEVSIWEALLLSTTYFTSGASAIISSVPQEFSPLGRSRYVVVILRLLGWVFFVLFLTSLGKIA